MKLIDVDKLKKDVLNLQDCYNGFSDTYDKAFIIGVIDEQPTAQPEIVRCKYCKWYGKVDKMFYRKNTCTNPRVQMKPSPMDYCSEGRRRKEDGET